MPNANATRIEIKGLDQLQAAFRQAPQIVREWLNKAIQASIFEVEKEATDDNFQFKTPRALRTGYLQRSFKFGITFGDLTGSIGPTAEYAPKVHSRNPFMPRIANSAKPSIERHFGVALEEIALAMAK